MNPPPHMRLRLRLPAALVCGLLLGRLELLSAKQGKRMFDTISYTSTVADEQFATRLQVGADGMGRLSLGSNRARRDRPIGQFQQLLPAPMLHKLTGLAAGADFAASPTQPALVPDETYRQISVARPGQAPLVKLVGEGMATPPAFGRFEQALQEVVDYLQQFPMLGIAMRMQDLPARLVVGQALPIVLSLRNTGGVPFLAELPPVWGQKATQCELRALRSDVAMADLRGEHQVFAQLDAKAFKRSEPAHAGKLAELLPSEQLGLWFESPAQWPPGRYSVELSLSLSLFNRDKKPQFVGSLVSAPQTVEVVAPPR